MSVLSERLLANAHSDLNFGLLCLIFQPFRHEAYSDFCLRCFAAWLDIVRTGRQPGAPYGAASATTGGSIQIEPTRTSGRSSAGSNCAAKAKRAGPKESRPDHSNGSGTRLQSAVECWS